MSNSLEKQEAFTGICKAIIVNPNGALSNIAFFCDAISNYDKAPIELEHTFHNIVFSFKNSMGNKWNSYYKIFPDKLKKKMKMRFNVE